MSWFGEIGGGDGRIRGIMVWGDSGRTEAGTGRLREVRIKDSGISSGDMPSSTGPSTHPKSQNYTGLRPPALVHNCPPLPP